MIVDVGFGDGVLVEAGVFVLEGCGDGLGDIVLVGKAIVINVAVGDAGTLLAQPPNNTDNIPNEKTMV